MKWYFGLMNLMLIQLAVLWIATGTRFCVDMNKMLSKGQVQERWRASPNPTMQNVKLRSLDPRNQTQLLGSFRKLLREGYSWGQLATWSHSPRRFWLLAGELFGRILWKGSSLQIRRQWWEQRRSWVSERLGSNVRFRFHRIESCEILKCILSDFVLER